MHLVISGTYGDTAFANTFFVQLGGYSAWLLGDVTAFISAIKTAIYASDPYGLMSNSVTVTALRGVLHQDTDLYLASEITGSFIGADTGFQQPASEAVCVSWQIAAHYRGGKPRTYMPGVTDHWVGTERLMDGTKRTTMVTRWNSALSAVNALTTGGASNVKLGTVSFQTGNAWRSPPVFRPYISANVHPRFATQRRRLGDWLP